MTRGEDGQLPDTTTSRCLCGEWDTCQVDPERCAKARAWLDRWRARATKSDGRAPAE